MKAGDRVTYRDIGLDNYRGVILSIERTPHGGDCWVQWSNVANRTEECLANLSPA